MAQSLPTHISKKKCTLNERPIQQVSVVLKRVKPSDFNLGVTAGSYSPSNFEPKSLKREEGCNQEGKFLAIYGKLPASDTGSTNSAMSLEDCAQSFDCNTEATRTSHQNHSQLNPKKIRRQHTRSGLTVLKSRNNLLPMKDICISCLTFRGSLYLLA
ncbi:uncharacterized protein [Drosophila takahashii]|uniref:uncharacterized protein n=1 Tax=Drosophila takahashii TaxID=29030 RepID=UPI0038994593